jgi:hypothetical protein
MARMARRGASEATRQASALQAGRRTISRGERPLYRVRAAQDGRWEVEGCPWLSIEASERRAGLQRTREAIAAWLEVEPDAFDVEG